MGRGLRSRPVRSRRRHPPSRGCDDTLGSSRTQRTARWKHGMSWLECLGLNVLAQISWLGFLGSDFLARISWLAKSDVYDSRISTVLRVGHGRFSRESRAPPVAPELDCGVFQTPGNTGSSGWGGDCISASFHSLRPPIRHQTVRCAIWSRLLMRQPAELFPPGHQKADDGSAGGRYTPPC
jgi:hypothetical protein